MFHPLEREKPSLGRGNTTPSMGCSVFALHGRKLAVQKDSEWLMHAAQRRTPLPSLHAIQSITTQVKVVV